MRYKKRSESGNHCGKYVKVRNKNIYGCYIRKGGEVRKICKCYKKRSEFWNNCGKYIRRKGANYGNNKNE